MKDSMYVVLNGAGIVRYRKSRPPLLVGEIAIKLNLEISDTWFRKIIPEGTVSIPDRAIIGDGLQVEFADMLDEQLEGINKIITIEIAAREQ